MRKPVYTSEDQWRTIVIMNLVHLRRTISGLAVIIAFLAVGAFVSQWWNYASAIVAVIALIATIVKYRTDAKDYEILLNLHFSAGD